MTAPRRVSNDADTRPTGHAPRCPAPIAVSISSRSSCAVAPATDINIHAPGAAIGRRPAVPRGLYGRRRRRHRALAYRQLPTRRRVKLKTGSGSRRHNVCIVALPRFVRLYRAFEQTAEAWCIRYRAEPETVIIRLLSELSGKSFRPSTRAHRNRASARIRGRASVSGDRSFSVSGREESEPEPETMMFGLHETMQSRMHGLKEEPSLLAPGVAAGAAGAGAMQHLMHHHHHHHHVPSVRNWMQPTVVDQAAALARYDSATRVQSTAEEVMPLSLSHSSPRHSLTVSIRVQRLHRI